MAFKKIKEGESVNVEKIYVRVQCPVCERYFRMQMKGSETRKNCPGCNRVTFIFVITNMRGGINVSAGYIRGADEGVIVGDLKISPNEVEIDEG